MGTNREKGYKVESKYGTRLKIFFILVAFLLFLLISKIYYIQIYKGEELRQKAVSQWFKISEKKDARGEIYDRNMIPLTNSVNRDFVIVKSQYNEEILYLLTRVSELDKEALINSWKNSDSIEVMIENYDDEAIQKLITYRGVSIIDRNIRYYNLNIANHIIGYINKSNNVGETGIEKYFNEELTKDREYKIGSIVDAKNEVIPGIGYIYFNKEEEGKLNVVTTLDYKIQRIVEKIIDDYNYNGSIIVLDGKNGNILAMVSRPDFDKNNIGDYLDSNKRELYNKAIQISYPPGSVFKIVVAAAALEDNLIDEEDKFYCNGFVDLYGNIIKCHAYESGGHGELTFKEGFAKSCNSVFIQAGRIIGGEEILKMANRLGLGEKTGIMIEEEVAGLLPSKDYAKGAGIGNISIGQGELEVTPLQIARITNIVLNNGIDKGVRLIDKIINDNGEVITEMPYKDEIRLLSSETSQALKSMMRDVIVYGTGKKAWVEGVEVAGKTGSAQAADKNRNTVHAWFTGFYTGKESEYVITILIEDGVSGGLVAAPVFKNIVTEMIKFGF